jgi:MFS family permease
VGGIRGEALEGLRWVYGHPTLRPFAVGTHVWFIFNGVAGAVLVPFALQTLGLTPFGLGLALSAAGVGGLLGSLAATRLGARFGVGRVVIACWTVQGVAYALLALTSARWSGWLLFGAGQLLFGLGLGAENSPSMGYRQAVTPDRLQGRMNTTMRSLNRAMIVVGAPLGGLLADRIGYRPMLWIVAAGFATVAVGLGLSRYRNARLGDSYTGTT